MKNIVTVMVTSRYIIGSMVAQAADGEWTGPVISVDRAEVITGSVSALHEGGAIGGLFGVAAMIGGQFVGSLVTNNQTAQVKRVLVHLSDDMETTFDMTSTEFVDQNIEVASRVNMVRTYSGAFQVTAAD